jgi:K+-sensing histidine kinase KdpD
MDLTRERRAARKATASAESAACVAISGAFSGAVLLRFQGRLAERCAGKLFATARPSRDEVREAMGELAARVAGNVKSLFPGVSKLALAVVADGGDPQLSVPGTHGAAEVDLQCEGKRLRVTLMRQDD